MSALPTVLTEGDRLTSALNDDPEFRMAARYWDCRLHLDLGDHAIGVVIAGGKVVDVAESPEGEWDIRIAGPSDGWAKLFAPVPPPFYTDIFPAARFHGFSMDGDMASLVAYHPAMRRMMDVIRESAA